MALTEAWLRSTYNSFLQRAKRYQKEGNVDKALQYIHFAAYTSHTFFLSSYFDNELEQLVKSLSGVIREKGLKYVGLPNRVVMLNSLSTFRGGVTTQYVRAIIEAGWELLFVTEHDMKTARYAEMNSELMKHSQITILEIPPKIYGRERLQFIYDAVTKYKPSRLYMHLSPYDAHLSSVCYSLPKEIEKFYIDYTDHSLALGAGACDYAFEFRSLGCSASVKFRGINKDNILLLPNYPVLDDVPFIGLPDNCKGKTIILSGGNPWKIVDSKDTFFRLARAVLQSHPDVMLVYAGGLGDRYMEQKIDEFGLSESFILLPWRPDVGKLFENSHIFMNTYPNGGGTMAQYAAAMSKPVLSYYPSDFDGSQGPNKVETLVCQTRKAVVSSYGEKAFLDKADRLISDLSFRASQGKLMHECVVDKEKFDSMFRELSVSHRNILPFEIDMSLERRASQITEAIKSAEISSEYQIRVVSKLGLSRITLQKELFIPFIRGIFPKIRRLFAQRGFHLIYR